jgi:excisionase family DNA binding protein
MSKPAYRSTAPAAVRPPAPEYLTKEIAAQRLHLSVRRVLELSARGMIKRRSMTDPATKRRQTVFLAQDVDRAVVDGNKRLVAYRGGAVGAIEAAAVPPPQPVSALPAVPDRLWLTMEEAANYSGLPASFLLQMIEDRRLPALDVGVRPGGRYRVARRDIDAITAPMGGRKKP